ncbi:MAG: efflux RND transporter permease subunit [Lysobacterales bacterium]
MSSKSLETARGGSAFAGPIDWMARHSIAANLLMILLITGGIWSAFNVQKEVYPEFDLDIVNVSVSYPGAAPAEVEQGILRPVESAIRGIEGIKEITSTAREGYGSIQVELVGGADRMKVFQDIDQAVNRIRTFPDDTEEPEVTLVSPRREVMNIVLYGPVDIWTLRKLAVQLRDQLLADPAITQVELGNAPDYVTHVEIPQQRLREYGLTLGQVANTIRRSSEDIPAGTIETNAGEVLLRLKERRQWAEDFEQIAIVTADSGAAVTLGQIGTITDGFEEAGFHSQFNQQPSVQIEIFRIGEQSPLEIAKRVDAIMADVETTLPAGVMWRIDSNSAKDYGQRLSLLLENGLMAIGIVLLILAAFLEIRLAFWVMMGMTISFVGSLLFLPVVGISINMISMFAFLVVMGIVVDDAIVVGENVYEYRQKGMDHLSAAIQGARDIATPVTFSILTTIVAFVPLLFMPGTTGKFWWPLPAVVIIVLAISLLEALYILPAHLAHSSSQPHTGPGRRLHAWQQSFAHGFSRFVDTRYRHFLDLCLRNRYITVSSAIAVLIVVGGYGMSGHMGMIMMPEVAADEIEAGIRLPVGTTPEQAARVANEVTASTRLMFDEHKLYEVAEGIKTNVRGGSFIDVEIVMKPPDEHDTPAEEVIALWREQIGDIEGVDQITFEAERGPGGWRQDISVDLSHSDIDVLAAASQSFLERVQLFEGAVNVNDNYDKGKSQFDFTLLPEGRNLGLTPADVGQQVRDAFFGALAMRQIRGTDEIEVRVKLPKEDRKDILSFADLIILTPDGVEVPLRDVVEVASSEAFSSISRRDGRRVVNVSLDVEPKREVSRVLEAIRAETLPQLRTDYPGLTWTFEGSDAEMRDSTSALWGGFVLAMAVVYALLAIAFGSYLQPFIVMFSIPFGIVGAVIGHIILGFDLSLISFMGVIALSGVVVNDALIMIDFANRKRAGSTPFEAIHMAGLRRFRPIILTTLTTFGGLTPIILETSRQAAYLVPMAISLGFGIVFATSIILLIVPCLYLILEDLHIAVSNSNPGLGSRETELS